MASVWQVVAAMRRQLGAGAFNAAALAVTMGAAGAACAGSYTNSATGNWSESGSWAGAAPGAGGAADTEIVFSSSGVNSTNNLGNFLLNRLEFAAGAATLSGNALVFTNNGATGPQIFNACGYLVTNTTPIVLGSDTTVYTSNSITLNGLISGKCGLVKTGPYNLTLTNNNTYVGTTHVSAGTLIYQSPGKDQPVLSTNFTVLAGATLRLIGNANPYWIAPASSVFTVQSNATFAIEVNAMQCGYLNAPSGATVTGSPQLMGLDKAAQKTAVLGSLNLDRIILVQSGATPTQTVRFDGTGAGLKIGTDSLKPFSWRNSGATGLLTYNMDIADSPAAAVDLLVPWLNIRPNATGIAFVKQGAGVMQLNMLDWTGGTANSNAPVACTVSGGTLVLNTSAYNGVGVNFAGLTVSNGATLQVGAGGTTGAIFTNVANEGTVAFNRSDAYTFGKVISGSGGVVQKGAGTLTLTGANTYGGATAVQAGTLLVNAPGSLSGSGEVAVTGGSILGGSGSISGPVTLAAGAALVPGGTNAVGTLTLASDLSLNGNSLPFDLSSVAGTCDQLPVTGVLVLNGANTIALSFPSGTPPAGTYTLMTYASKTGSGTLALNTFYPNATLTVGDTSATLTVTGPGITYLKWTGSASGVWDTTTTNWTRDGAASVYADGDAVMFDDTATGNFTIRSETAVSPSSVTFNNSVSNYTLSASIDGTNTAVFKLGTSLATLTGTNTYGGGTTFSAGTLSINAYTNLPASGGLTFSGGTLGLTGFGVTSLDKYAVNWGSFNGGLNITNLNASLTVTNAIGGSGSLTKAGMGTLVLLGTNTYSGGTIVSAGAVRISSESGVGSGAINMTGYNCQLDLMGGLNMNNAITIRGVGVANSVGSLQSYTGTSNTWSGPITLGDSGARLGGANATLTVSGVIAGNVSLVKAGNGTLALANTNTTCGSFTVNGGTLAVSGTGTLGVNSTNILVNAGTLALSNSVCIADTATLRIANGGGAKVSLAAGVDESVGALWFGGKQKPRGTYGATGSGASVTDDEHFAGGGLLTVLHGNGGTLIRLN